MGALLPPNIRFHTLQVYDTQKENRCLPTMTRSHQEISIRIFPLKYISIESCFENVNFPSNDHNSTDIQIT